MKTIKEWLEELPEPYRKKSINNTPKKVLEVYKQSLEKALLASFVWNNSKEGHDYWVFVFESLED